MAVQADKRESILARLALVLAAVDGIEAVFRNRIEIPENKRPAAVILDADETQADTQIPEGRGRPIGASPCLMAMTPEIYLLTGDAPASIGTDLNDLRTKVLKAVLQDETLISLCKDGDITYLGFTTGLASGRSMEGEAGISFQFQYVLFPSLL